MVDISVIIPVYNVEEYLEDCLESVLNQTFENYEVICVNDCTEDNSMVILEKYMQVYEKIRVFQSENNVGISEARNIGLRQARGKYVLFVDSDDMIEKETLEELFQCAEEEQLDELVFNMRKIYEKGIKEVGQERQRSTAEDLGVCSGRELFWRWIEDNSIKEEVWRRFLRKDFLFRNNIWFYKGIIHEDTLFSFYCDMNAQRAKEISKIYYVYRQRANSIMRARYTVKRGQSIFILLNEFYKYWCTHDFTEREHKLMHQHFQSLYGEYCYYRDTILAMEKVNTLEIGDFPVQSLYAILTKPVLQYADLSKDKIEKIRHSKFIILFGAGYAAREVMMILKREKIEVNAVAVSTPKNNMDIFWGHAVEDIKNLVKHKKYATVIIGTTSKYTKEMEQYLVELGFEDIVKIDSLGKNIYCEKEV